jgi:undecaprenyl phosphate-alpha-L-ara4N flippase subunit ArnF
LLTGLVVIFGDVLIKIAAERSGSGVLGLLGLGCLVYALSAVLWFWAMRHTTLAQAGVAYSMFTLLALAVIGAVWFKESLAPREWAGIGCALVSMGLMARFE